MAVYVAVPRLGGGGVVHVLSASIFRVGPLAPEDGDPKTSRVEWDGGGFQVTPLTVNALAELVASVGVHLVKFHGEGDTEVFLNVAKIVAVGPADSYDYSRGLPTLITVGGKPQAVHETQQQVYQAIGATT